MQLSYGATEVSVANLGAKGKTGRASFQPGKKLLAVNRR